jgi:nitrogen-specific signal transduction histidine kinase
MALISFLGIPALFFGGFLYNCYTDMAKWRAKKAWEKREHDICSVDSWKKSQLDALWQQERSVNEQICSCLAAIQEEKDRQAEARDRPFRAKRKQTARQYFSDLLVESRNPLNGEGLTYIIHIAMSDLSDFSTDRINMADADLDRVKGLLSDLKNDREKIEIIGFTERRKALAEQEKKENGTKEPSSWKSGSKRGLSKRQRRRPKSAR